LIEARTSSRPEAAFVLQFMQAMLWAMAGISAIPFAIFGEVFMIGLGIGSLLLALATGMLGIGILWRRRRARRCVMALEITCLAGSVLLLVLPIGANHGPVSLMTNFALPIAILLLVRRPPEAFL